MQKYIDAGDRQVLIISSLDKLVDGINQLQEQIVTANILENSVIAHRDADRDELKSIASGMNQVRQVAIARLVEFYADVRANTDDSELNSIIKAFNKDLSVTSR